MNNDFDKRHSEHQTGVLFWANNTNTTQYLPSVQAFTTDICFYTSYKFSKIEKHQHIISALESLYGIDVIKIQYPLLYEKYITFLNELCPKDYDYLDKLLCYQVNTSDFIYDIPPLNTRLLVLFGIDVSNDSNKDLSYIDDDDNFHFYSYNHSTQYIKEHITDTDRLNYLEVFSDVNYLTELLQTYNRLNIEHETDTHHTIRKIVDKSLLKLYTKSSKKTST